MTFVVGCLTLPVVSTRDTLLLLRAPNQLYWTSMNALIILIIRLVILGASDAHPVDRAPGVVVRAFIGALVVGNGKLLPKWTPLTLMSLIVPNHILSASILALIVNNWCTLPCWAVITLFDLIVPY